MCRESLPLATALSKDKPGQSACADDLPTVLKYLVAQLAFPFMQLFTFGSFVTFTQFIFNILELFFPFNTFSARFFASISQRRQYTARKHQAYQLPGSVNKKSFCG
jgi:hypothetical protein